VPDARKWNDVKLKYANVLANSSTRFQSLNEAVLSKVKNSQNKACLIVRSSLVSVVEREAKDFCTVLWTAHDDGHTVEQLTTYLTTCIASLQAVDVNKAREVFPKDAFAPVVECVGHMMHVFKVFIEAAPVVSACQSEGGQVDLQSNQAKELAHVPSSPSVAAFCGLQVKKLTKGWTVVFASVAAASVTSLLSSFSGFVVELANTKQRLPRE
jgi:hypothetical protein